MEWSRQDRDMSRTKLPGSVQVVRERGISIHHVHPGDQGVYVCHASNKAGSVSASAMLRVQVRK